MQPPMKHIVDVVNSAEVGAATRTVQLVQGVLNPDPFVNVTNVKAGSKVTHLEIQLDINADSLNGGTITYFDCYVWFNINGAQGTPLPTLVGANHLKNQVFHQEGALMDTYVSRTDVGWVRQNPKVFRMSISIPRQWQQINDGDTIELVYRYSSALNFTTKVKAIYKEFFP